MKKLTINLDITVTVHADENASLSPILVNAAQQLAMVGYEDGYGNSADIVDAELHDWKVEDSR